eukprot:SAG11_NODE_1002_length_6214_cov_2.976124_4_plen_305_part_00
MSYMYGLFCATVKIFHFTDSVCRSLPWAQDEGFSDKEDGPQPEPENNLTPAEQRIKNEQTKIATEEAKIAAEEDETNLQRRFWAQSQDEEFMPCYCNLRIWRRICCGRGKRICLGCECPGRDVRLQRPRNTISWSLANEDALEEFSNDDPKYLLHAEKNAEKSDHLMTLATAGLFILYVVSVLLTDFVTYYLPIILSSLNSHTRGIVEDDPCEDWTSPEFPWSPQVTPQLPSTTHAQHTPLAKKSIHTPAPAPYGHHGKFLRVRGAYYCLCTRSFSESIIYLLCTRCFMEWFLCGSPTSFARAF